MIVFKIKYGVLEHKIDITNIALTKCLNNDNILFIPRGDTERACIFSDPVPGKNKSIFIETNGVDSTEYDVNTEIFINPSEYINPYIRLKNIHDTLNIYGGTFNDELPEQIMVSKYIYGNEKILEIGGNIGRNSLVIGYLLNQQNNKNFVSLECDSSICEDLRYNKNINNLKFYVENSALSKRSLIQKGWDTICSDVLLEGYKPVNTITLDELNQKYNIVFDTLVLDCQGAFYYILQDMPEVLNNINLIIMENDYYNHEHKLYVDNILKMHDFYVDYSECGGWGPCKNYFFEVWKK